MVSSVPGPGPAHRPAHIRSDVISNQPDTIEKSDTRAESHGASPTGTQAGSSVSAASLSRKIPYRLIGGVLVAAFVAWYLFVFDDAGNNDVVEGFTILGDGFADLPGLVTDGAGYRSWWDYMSDGTGFDTVLNTTLDHVQLVAFPMVIAIVVGIAMGILAHRVPTLRGIIIGFSSILLTIPSLALFSILIPVSGIGIGDRPAMIALFLYALLPILRNTIVGLEEVDTAVSESAKGMGLGYTQRLLKIELPLAWPVILTGIRVATLLNIGIAAIAALVGGSGLGEYVRTGLQRYPGFTAVERMWTGVVFTVVLALIADAVIAIVRKITTSKGLS